MLVTVTVVRTAILPEKHAHAGVGDLALYGLPRPDDGEQFALGERHRRQVRVDRRPTADRARTDEALGSTGTRQPPQQRGHRSER